MRRSSRFSCWPCLRFVGAAVACLASIAGGPGAARSLTLHQAGYTATPFLAPTGSPVDLEVDGGGSLYLSFGSGGVEKCSPAGVVSPWSAAGASDLTLGPAGSGYTAGRGLCRCIESIGSDGSHVVLHQDAYEWTNVELGPNDTLYATVWAGSGQGLYRVDRNTGEPTPIVIGGPGPGGSGIYRDLAFGLDGRLYVVGSADGSVAGYSLFRLDGPTLTPAVALPHGGINLARDESGIFYVTTAYDYGSGRPVGEVWRVDAALGSASLFASTDPDAPLDPIAHDPGTGRLYVYEGGKSAREVWAITKTSVPARVESWGGLKARYRVEGSGPAGTAPPLE